MKVLVVDDDEEACALLSRALGHAGHQVALAFDAHTAQVALAKEGFDVIVLDVGLPDRSGLALCQRLREEQLGTPILFLSARGSVADRVDGLESGGDDYLIKPFSLKELQARLRALCRRGPALRPRRLVGREVVVDLGARRATRGGAEVPLTAREWDVLEALGARPGLPMGYDDLLEAAWGDASEAARASLEVIIARLRRKLDGARTDSSSIRTVRGFGYALGLNPEGTEGPR